MLTSMAAVAPNSSRSERKQVATPAQPQDLGTRPRQPTTCKTPPSPPDISARILQIAPLEERRSISPIGHDSNGVG
jgi:hypothetical protein